MKKFSFLIVFLALSLSTMAQTKVVQIAGRDTSAEWLEPVTDAEYNLLP